MPPRQLMSCHYAHAIEISASRELVWRVMADVMHWAEWTPSITRIVTLTPGSVGVGSRVRIHQPGLPPAFWRVTEWIPGQSFTWVSRIPGIRVSARHEVTAATHGCRVTLSLDYEGFLGGFLACLTHRFNAINLQLEANGLKKHCEALSK